MTYSWAHLITGAWSRFIAKVHAPDALGCWIWTGAKSRGKGNRAYYGSFTIAPGITVRAHIFACAAAGFGRPGEHRDHFVCGNTLCVNTAHIEPCTPRENSLRRWRSTPTWRKAA